jgi:hypothetical protein
MANHFEVTLPCKIGDQVWGIRRHGGNKVAQPGLVSEMYFIEDMKLVIAIKHICRGTWGKNIFPTYEAAQAALDKDLFVRKDSDKE